MIDRIRTGGALLRGVEERQELERRALRVPDPPIGAPRDGIYPGKWGHGDDSAPSPDEFPADCPVKVLGYNGGDLYVIDAMGQFRVISEKFSLDTVTKLFGHRIGFAYWAWPRFGKAKQGQPAPVDTFRAERVNQSFWGEASRRGLFANIEHVRGRGVWAGPGGGLVVHCGDYLYVNGKLAHTGEVDGAIYPKMAAILHPFREAVGPEPALEVMEFFKTCFWARPRVDPVLMLGWIGSALMSGVLAKRPSIFIVGDKGWGKTTVQQYIKLIFGEYLLQANDVTPAGIYQTVRQDARPVAVDELEAGANIEKVLRVTALAKLGYDGAVMLRGGSDHNPMEFRSRSSFLMSAINPPPVPPAEMSRMGVLSLVRPDKSRFGDPRVIREEDMIGPRIFKRLIDGWSGFDRLSMDYKAALKDGGHEQRGQETYGTLLACAHIMLGDEGMDALGYPIENFGEWSSLLHAPSMPEYEDARENWAGAISVLLSSNIDLWRGGSQLSVGAILDALEHDDLKFSGANAKLAQVGLKLISGREFGRAADHLILAVPNATPQLARLFQGSDWAAGPSGHGVWTSALRQSPPGVLVQGEDNRITINRVTSRCTLIDLKVYDELTRPPGRAKPAGGFGGPVADEGPL